MSRDIQASFCPLPTCSDLMYTCQPHVAAPSSSVRPGLFQVPGPLQMLFPLCLSFPSSANFSSSFRTQLRDHPHRGAFPDPCTPPSSGSTSGGMGHPEACSSSSPRADRLECISTWRSRSDCASSHFTARLLPLRGRSGVPVPGNPGQKGWKQEGHLSGGWRWVEMTSDLHRFGA